MNLSDLLKLLIPAVFLIIWALNQLLGKEEVTAPPRGQPIGPRPGGLPPAPRPPSSQVSALGRPASSVGTPPANPSRPLAATASPRTSPVGFGEPDEIFVIRGDQDPAPRPNAGAGSGSTRRSARARSSKRAPEPATPKRLTAALPTSLNLAPTDQVLSAQPPSVERSTSETTVALALNDLIRSPARLREALILNEILGPPRALRGLGR